MIEIKTYQRTDLEEIVQLFYQTVHFVNIQDYTKEQVDPVFRSYHYIF